MFMHTTCTEPVLVHHNTVAVEPAVTYKLERSPARLAICWVSNIDLESKIFPEIRILLSIHPSGYSQQQILTSLCELNCDVLLRVLIRIVQRACRCTGVQGGDCTALDTLPGDWFHRGLTFVPVFPVTAADVASSWGYNVKVAAHVSRRRMHGKGAR